MILNKHSYRYEYTYYNSNSNMQNGLFDNYIDVAYILTLENSTRRDKYIEQISRYKPHSKIIIQHNLGFKKCKKNLYKQITYHDLNDAYYHAFLHAKLNNYINILIFEDDFFFDNVQKKDVHEIGIFIKNNEYHIYNLGPGLNISIPCTLKHHLSIISTCSHGVIYNVKYIDFFINKYNEGFDAMCDSIWNMHNIIKYKYYKPICFQTFPMTENIQNWSLSKLAIFFINMINLDKCHQPGYTVLNILSYIIPVIICVFYLFILFKNGK